MLMGSFFIRVVQIFKGDAKEHISNETVEENGSSLYRVFSIGGACVFAVEMLLFYSKYFG